MKQIVLLFLMIMSLAWSSCDECTCDANQLIGELKIRLTLDEENPEVLITIFEGKIENQDTIFSGYVVDTEIFLDLDANVYYSATAHYVKSGRNYVAVDGREMTTSTDECDCEYANNRTLDLRLKN